MIKRIVLVAGGEIDLLQLVKHQKDQFCYFIGVDRGAWRLLQANLPLHFAVGDFDSIADYERAIVTEKANQVVSLQTEKDETDTEVAFRHIVKDLPKVPVIAYGLLGGRLDHTLSNLFLGLNAEIKDAITRTTYYHPDYQVQVLFPGEHHIFARSEFKYLSFVNLLPVEDLTLQHVKYPLTHYDISHPHAYISNEFLPGHVEMILSFVSGLILAIQARDH